MEIRQLQYFVEFIRDLNFSKTAKRLYITPQGLSKAIHALEDDLQVPLITNANGRVELTIYGKALAKDSIQIIEQIETTKRNITHMYQLENKNISLNLSNTIRCIVPAQVHNDFNQQHPDITLTTHEYRDMECEQKLLTGEIDIAISLGPLDPEYFQTYPLFDSPYIIMVHRSHHLASKRVIRFSDLVGEPLIGMDKNYKTYYLFKESAIAHGVELQFAEEVDGALNMFFLCQGNHQYVGTLIGYLPRLFQDRSIRYIPFAPNEFILRVCIAYLKGRYKPYALKTYINFIRNYDHSSYCLG